MDLSGRRFGRWTVLGKDTAKTKPHWHCLCDCGKQKSIASSHLLRGASKSCGCLMRELVSLRRRDPLGPANRIFNEYKRNADKAGRAFTLTLSEFETIITSRCHYCGAPPSGWISDSRKTPPFGGVDRILNAGGYTPDNVVPACGMCNHMKHTWTQQEFRDKIEAIFHFWVSRNA